MSAALDLATFAGVMVLAQFSPGPDMVLLTQTSLKKGARVGVEMALGIASGLMVHATMAVAGLALAFERLPMLSGLMHWAAALYLLWLAWHMVRERFIHHDFAGTQTAAEVAPVQRPYFQGLWCNLLNPKAAIFLAAISAPFLKGMQTSWWPYALWLIIVGQGMLLWSLWAWFLQWQPLRRGYERASATIDGAFALVLASLAIWLLVS
jgi:threonine efflux protein